MTPDRYKFSKKKKKKKKKKNNNTKMNTFTKKYTDNFFAKNESDGFRGFISA